MRSLPVPRMRRAAVAATALVGLALTGCADAQPGVVAYVGEQRITEAELDTAVAGLSSTLEEGQTVSSEGVLNAMIQGRIAEQIATEQGIPLSNAARDQALAGTDLAGLASAPATREVAYDVADSQIVAQALGSEAYLADVQRSEVTLNPRYGVLDPAQKIIVTGQSGSLSQPAPADAPTGP